MKSYQTLIKGARLVVERCFDVQEGDSVLVICDEDHRREAEAIRVGAFLDGLGDQVAQAEAVSIFNTLRKQDMLGKLSEGTASLYFTPAEVDLSIETHQSLPASDRQPGSRRK